MIYQNPGGGALECHLTGRCPFFKSLHNPFRKEISILIPCFGIFRLQNNRKTIGKTIAFCSWTNSHNPFWNFWLIFIPCSGIYAEKWYPGKQHIPYQFIWKCPPPGIKIQLCSLEIQKYLSFENPFLLCNLRMIKQRPLFDSAGIFNFE